MGRKHHTNNHTSKKGKIGRVRPSKMSAEALADLIFGRTEPPEGQQEDLTDFLIELGQYKKEKAEKKEKKKQKEKPKEKFWWEEELSSLKGSSPKDDTGYGDDDDDFDDEAYQDYYDRHGGVNQSYPYGDSYSGSYNDYGYSYDDCGYGYGYGRDCYGDYGYGYRSYSDYGVYSNYRSYGGYGRYSYNTPVLNKFRHDWDGRIVKENRQKYFKGEENMRPFRVETKPDVFITPEVYDKMTGLVAQAKNTEIAWHCFVKRIGEPKMMIFEVYDILVYPQVVSGSTVNPDADEYAKWFEKEVLSRDDAINCRFHGHSHVNFACTPSPTDNTFRNDTLANFNMGADAGPDDYYIFMIMNQRGEYTIELYDPVSNIVYTGDNKSSDISMIIDSYDGMMACNKWVQEQIASRLTTHAATTKAAAKTQTETAEEKKEREVREWIAKYGGRKEFGYGPGQIYITATGYRAESEWHTFLETEKAEREKDPKAFDADLKKSFFEYLKASKKDEKNSVTTVVVAPEQDQKQNFIIGQVIDITKPFGSVENPCMAEDSTALIPLPRVERNSTSAGMKEGTISFTGEFGFFAEGKWNCFSAEQKKRIKTEPIKLMHEITDAFFAMYRNRISKNTDHKEENESCQKNSETKTPLEQRMEQLEDLNEV